MIHSNAPWVPSGYGRQAALLGRQLLSLGHDVAYSAFHGLSGAVLPWRLEDTDRDVPVYPAGKADYGIDIMAAHAQHWGADVLLTLMDVWKMAPAAHIIRGQLAQAGIRLACWVPTDCTPLGRPDRQVLQAIGAVPIAMSLNGADQLRDALGVEPLYAPHSFDPDYYFPTLDYYPALAEQRAPDSEPTGRKKMRDALGATDGTFLVGMCAANRDAVRKSFPEVFAAVAEVAELIPELRLALHADPLDRGGYNLLDLLDAYGITDLVAVSDAYAQTAGLLDDVHMGDWFRSIDVLVNPSYAEGFGIPVLEAQACGTPAIVTNMASLPQVAAASIEAGYDPVATRPFWNPVHGAWWGRPEPDDLANAIVSAYDRWKDNISRGNVSNQRKTIADGVASYTWQGVAGGFWRPILDQLAAS